MACLYGNVVAQNAYVRKIPHFITDHFKRSPATDVMLSELDVMHFVVGCKV